ncbi:SDR family oxidoreductase [Streptomyces sp. NPDC002896]|uniref:SDR family NAD(P)-dependent oxidoreductase n=1 Tax=Streptomyces sp. NPDC002896 TaxID=3154438 RepID=UPI00332A4F3A
MTNLHGRVALVTGAGQPDGIGQGIVKALLRSGADGVVFTDIDTEMGEESLKIAASEFGVDRLLFLRQEVSSEADWEQTHAAVFDRFGGLDILVNNAGASFGGSLATLSLEDVRRGMSVNFESQFIGIKTCMGSLIERADRWPGGTAIINNSSVGAYLADPTNLTYNVSKAAVRMLSMCAARELGGKNVRVNSIHFGTIDTPLLRASFERRVDMGQYPDTDAARQAMERNAPLKRMGTPEDAGALAAFLASDEARYLTGAAYICDGGLTTQY